ncbi:tyrosine-type recombinase/integrase [Acaryochloris marina NIES-2412]|uniref:tyrosine-type recombinase/integrase n=1 Tax=Acaryochloris marina TaxID=155978 RepID=UPI0040588314
MSRFSQTSDIPPVRLIEFGAEKSEVRTVPVKPAVVNLRSQRIEQFLTLKNLAANTRRNYERHLKQFSLWVNKDWHQITMNDLKRYKTYLESGRELKQGSVGAVLIAIKSFFSWLIKAGYIEDNPSAAISIPVTPETEGKNLELFQVEALFEALTDRSTEIRDRAILCLMIYAGLRAEEISLLNAGDYNGVEITIRQAKHGSVGKVPVDDLTDQALRANLQIRMREGGQGLSAEDPMFVSTSHRNKGQRLGYEGIYKLVKALAQDAGWPDIHPHKGRHTYASQLIENGMDAYLAMTLMRQRSVKAFEVYSQKVRYRTAKGVFLESKGEVERQPMPLEELVGASEMPVAEEESSLAAVPKATDEYCYFGDGSFNEKTLGQSRRYHLPKADDPGRSKCGATFLDPDSRCAVNQMKAEFEVLLCKRCFKPSRNSHQENLADEEPANWPKITAVDLPLHAVRVRLTIEISGKKKGKVRKEIEERVLSPHQMVKPNPRGNEYELTVVVKEDDDLSQITDQMKWDMEVLGELDDCTVKVKLRSSSF